MRNTESPGQPLMQVNVAMQFQNRFFKLNDQSDGKSEFVVDSDVSVQSHKKSFNWKRLVAGRWNLMYSAVREIHSICSTNSRRFATTKRQTHRINKSKSLSAKFGRIPSKITVCVPYSSTECLPYSTWYLYVHHHSILHPSSSCSSKYNSTAVDRTFPSNKRFPQLADF